jgi:hypothetical protein
MSRIRSVLGRSGGRVLALASVAVAATGCGSSGSAAPAPQGLTGSQDREAAAVLTLAPGSFLAGKTTVVSSSPRTTRTPWPCCTHERTRAGDALLS